MVTNETRGRRLFGIGSLVTLFAGILAGQPLSPAQTPPGTTHAPDEFGTQDYTVTVIGAGSFTPASDNNSNSPTYATDGNLSRINSLFGDDQHYYATVTVPAGAVIDFIGLEGACGAPSVTGVQLWDIGRYGSITSVASFSCTQHGLDTDYNSAPIGYQVASNVHHLLMLDVEMATITNPGSFTWVEVWWKRTVSPAPGSPSFNDVPTSHPFFQYIEALKASGITGGCQASPPLYCPDNPLTRGQMAVFLAKGLGLHWPN